MSTNHRYGDYVRELADLDFDDDGGEWEPCYLPAWFVATVWGGVGWIVGYLMGVAW